MGYKSSTQLKNIAWYLPRPKKDHYKGGMPLYAEEWLIELGKDILGNDNPRILNVFCGMNKYGTRVDLNPEVNPDILGDVHQLTDLLGNRKFDIILADPPYSNEETLELYGEGYPKLQYNVWTTECTKVLSDKGLLIVYHKYIMPNPDPLVYSVEKRVFIGSRTYHVPRVAIYFRKGVRYGECQDNIVATKDQDSNEL